VYLGLEASVDLSIRPPAWVAEAKALPEEPAQEPERLPFALSECVRAAFANRLDLKTVEDQVEDAERGVRLAANGLLPELDFEFRYDLSHDPVQDYEETAFDGTVSAGFRLGVPWDYRSERDALFRARVDLERARRGLQLFRDQLRQEIRERFRAAELVRLTLYIQDKIRVSAAKRLRISEFRFREGEISNRDVVEAQEALLQAENRFVQALTERRIRDFELARSMGILSVDGAGLPAIPGWPREGTEDEKTNTEEEER
jgi:outer membrane protein TolC